MGGDNFQVDQARYITFNAVVKGLDRDVMTRLKSVSSIAAKKSSATAQASNDDVYMVIILVKSAIEFHF